LLIKIGENVFFLKKTTVFLIVLVLLVFARPNLTTAAMSPHPLDLYERGEALIEHYQGNVINLVQAQEIFIDLISKYPRSPFGYLGMSHIYRLDAYLGNDQYNIDLIRNRALPFALQAMRLGPSIREVHENYVFFEKFLQEDVANHN